MSLDERSDELDRQMASHPAEESIKVLVKDASRSKRRVRILAISVALDIFLTVGLAIVSFRTSETAHLAQSNKAAVFANCETANDSRSKQLVLWDYVLALTPEQPRTPEQEARVRELGEFVHRTFAQRDCSTEVNQP